MPVSIFILVVVLVNGVYLGWVWFETRRHRMTVYDRLEVEAVKSERTKSKLIELDVAKPKSLLERFVAVVRVEAPLEALLVHAGDRSGVRAFLRKTVLFGCGAAVAGALLLPYGALAGALILGLPAAVVPFALLRRAATKRIFRFEEQFPACLEFVSRSMRAGHGFSVALELISTEFEEPLAGEFKHLYEEHSLGMPLDVAMRKLAVRVPLLSVQFFVCAVTLQKRTGGNLAEVLDKLAGIIRERFKLQQRVKVISAHGKMTATALTLIPAAVGGLMWVANPRYMSFFLHDGTGPWLALSAVVMQMIGYAIIRQMVKIEA
jgi:tight adherence protein B